MIRIDQKKIEQTDESFHMFRLRTPRQRRLGFLKDKIIVHPTCFDPMDEDELKLWEEGDSHGPLTI